MCRAMGISPSKAQTAGASKDSGSTSVGSYAAFVPENISVLGISLVLLGIALEILGGYVSGLVQFLKEKESALAISLLLGIALGRYASPLVEFLKEKKRFVLLSRSCDLPLKSTDTFAIVAGQMDNDTCTAPPHAGTWIMDSGAQCHGTGDLRLFSGHLNMTSEGSWISGVSGHRLPIRGFGTVQFPDFTLQQVYYVEGLGRNLISVSKFQKTLGYKVTLGKDANIQEEATGRRICEIRTVQGLYELSSMPVELDFTPAAEEKLP